MYQRRYFLGSVAVCAALSLAAPAHAQSATEINRQIQALQDQVRALNQQLQTLQNQVIQTQRNQAATEQAVRSAPAPAATPAPAPGGIVASMPNNRPTLSTADNQNSVSLVGRIHWDVGDYLSYTPATRQGGAGTPPTNLNSGENLRRARIGVQGKVAGDWNYALIYDFGGTNDNGPGTGGTSAAASGGVEVASLGYSGFRPLTIEAGIQDTLYTLAEATSSNDIMFLERASPAVVAMNLAAGDFRSAAGARWTTDRLWLGAYFTGPTTGTLHTGVVQQMGAFQRATYQVLQSDRYSFHIGASAEELIKPPISGPGGFRQVTTFADRPELRIDPTQILNTGTLGSATNPVTGAHVLGFETAGGFGPIFGQAEYFHYTVGRQGLSDANFNGGYLEASYTLTGEQRKYNSATGAYSGISPAHPFQFATFTNGDWGALELAARYSIIDLNSNYTSGQTTSPSTSAVAGGEQQVIALGANWYVNNNIRFMLDYLHGIITKHQGNAGVIGVPLGSGVGAHLNALALRTQVAW